MVTDPALNLYFVGGKYLSESVVTRIPIQPCVDDGFLRLITPVKLICLRSPLASEKEIPTETAFAA